MSPSKKARPSSKARRTAKRSAPRVPSGRSERVEPASPPGHSWRIAALRILALLAVVAISALVFSVRQRVEDYAALGLPGVFLVALLANATVLLPAPGIAVVFAMGSVFHPLAVGLAAGTGGALGELSGYLAGFSGQAVVERAALYERIQPWVRRYGPWAILVLAAIPNPTFDLAGVAAGVVKMPVWQFLLFCWVGQLIKMTAVAYSGAYSLNWLTDLFQL